MSATGAERTEIKVTSSAESEERALLTALRVNQRGAGQACRAGMRPLLGCVMHYSRHSLGPVIMSLCYWQNH